MGVHFKLSCEVGKDVPMSQLLSNYDALFIGVGTYRSMKAGIPHEDAHGVYDALPFLVANTRHVMGLEPTTKEPFIDTQGLNVVVLGAVIRRWIACAQHYVMVRRKSPAPIAGMKPTCPVRKEVKNAKDEGAEFEFNVQPVELVLAADGQVKVSGCYAPFWVSRMRKDVVGLCLLREVNSSCQLMQ